MIRSLSARRWVAVIATIMLLLCQTAAAALSRAPSGAQATALAQEAAAPCHHDGAAGGDSTPSNGCQERCPARDASLEKTKIDIPSAHALLLTVIALLPPISRVAAASCNDFTATATPPPLRLVYCRLLN